MRGVLAFDSGIGGYGIVGALRRRLPQLPVSMIADNAFYPYGELADEALVARVEAVIGAAVAELAPRLVVIACNTASTLALTRLRARFDLPFVGCVPPVKWAASLSRSRHIGLLATAATVRRAYVTDLSRRFAADCRLIAYGARGLADLAERAFRFHPIERAAVWDELAGLFGQDGGGCIDTVCIGCTHYSVLLDILREVGPDRVAWLDPADAVARRAQVVLSALPPEPEAAGGLGTALFTAPPFEPARIETALRRQGFEGYRLLAVPQPTARLSAGG